MSTTPLLRPKILVVDDTPANLLVMRKLLAKVDAELIEAASGSEALSACLDHEFALILLDVNMPEMDGFETASLIAEEDNNRLTPIIFVTAAYGDDVNRLRGYHAGAVDYIAKPINDHILHSKVRVFLDLWRARQALHEMALDLQQRNRQLEDEVRERQRIEALVRHEAYHDSLTGLPNRVLLLDRIDTATERAKRQQGCFALLFVDIDGFKPVNDQHGHAAGDALLQQIGQRLLAGVRRSDTVARLGGDEFAVILEAVVSSTYALQVADALCMHLGALFELDRSGARIAVQIGGSIGVAMYPDHGINRDQLLSAADSAMYIAKRAGKGRCHMAPQQESLPL